MTDVTDAITQAASENGIDPATALAIAERESSLNPNERAKGSSAYGLFQLLKAERDKYGGNSADPYEQSSAWGHYIQGTKNDMARVLGRDPSGTELYLGHYWGGPRAARIINGTIAPDTPVTDVFSPAELRANPNIARAGTVGNLAGGVSADVDRRIAKFSGMTGAQFPSSDASIGDAGVQFPASVGGHASPPTQDSQDQQSRPLPLNPAVPGPPQVPGA